MRKIVSPFRAIWRVEVKYRGRPREGVQDDHFKNPVMGEAGP
jgi:hypothetical protein